MNSSGFFFDIFEALFSFLIPKRLWKSLLPLTVNLNCTVLFQWREHSRPWFSLPHRLKRSLPVIGAHIFRRIAVYATAPPLIGQFTDPSELWRGPIRFGLLQVRWFELLVLCLVSWKMWHKEVTKLENKFCTRWAYWACMAQSQA